MIRTVAFDVMDTLLHDPFREALEAATGGPPEDFFAQRDPELYRSLERGDLAEDEYWQRVRDGGVAVDPRRFHEVRRERTRWITGVPELLDELGGVVERVTASNYPRWIDELETRFLEQRTEQVIASCHLGVRKPDRAFFVALLERLGRPADEVAFVDDREVNVEAAREAGLPAHRFREAERLRDWLVQVGVPLR